MSTPKFKIGDRVNYSASGAPPYVGKVMAVRVDLAYGCQYQMHDGDGLWWHESHLSLDVPETPKFKIGDRVKWRDSDGRDRAGAIHAYDKLSQRYFLVENDFIVATWWYESHLSLDVPETHKFKIGDRVKWAHFGKPSFGFVRARLSEGWWKVEYTAGCMENCHESGLSLDVPEPKQFATNREVELGAEIIRLNFQIADQKKMSSVQAKGRMEDREQIKNLAYLDASLFEEIGGRHRERIAKEAAQKELAEAREQIERLERKSKAQVESITHLVHRLAESRAGCEAEKQIETAQKALVEANDMINRLKTFIGLP